MKKILSIACLFVFAILLTACSSGLKGTYKLVEMAAGEEKYDAKTLETLEIKMELVVKDDKTAELTLDGETISLTYNDKEFIGKDQSTGEEKSIPYTVDGNKIILTDDGETMTFQK